MLKTVRPPFVVIVGGGSGVEHWFASVGGRRRLDATLCYTILFSHVYIAPPLANTSEFGKVFQARRRRRPLCWFKNNVDDSYKLSKIHNPDEMQ